MGAEGAKRGARISQAKGQRRFQIILVRLFGQMRDSSVLFFAHAGICSEEGQYIDTGGDKSCGQQGARDVRVLSIWTNSSEEIMKEAIV